MNQKVKSGRLVQPTLFAAAVAVVQCPWGSDRECRPDHGRFMGGQLRCGSGCRSF